LPADEAGLLAYARALSIWHARHCYCGVCASPTLPVSAGHCLRCSREACAQDYFPRLDPAIIVLVSDGERALLGRQAGWPARRYSTIAGFVEPGESLEDALAREVLEEWTSRLRAEAGDEFPTHVTAFRPGMAVHGRFGQPCPLCGAPVQRIVYAENETNYCARCQTRGIILADRALSRLLKASWPKSIDELG